jgi:rhamnogalacturonyl hydrolase YesR
MGIQSKETVSIIRKVYMSQLKNLQSTFPPLSGRREKIINNGWIRSVFLIGVMAARQATEDKKYREVALKWAEANRVNRKSEEKKEGLLNGFYFFSFSRYFKSSRSFGRPVAPE